ncbi:MAG: hypothetical protein ACI3XG_02450 [Faecousia sp.]
MRKRGYSILLALLALCLVTCCLPAVFGLEADPQWDGEAADCSVGLEDGEYVPEGFSFSGGTGKVKITCDRVTVQDGIAYARLQFSSSTWSYVRSNGFLCYGEIVDGKSLFTIPVRLNANNTIQALTTRMSAPHEVEYTIFIQLSSAPSNASAPEVRGLTFLEEIPLADARHLKLLRYQGGAILIQIDTGFQPSPAPELSEEEKTAVDYAAALYHEQLLQYLLVPEGMELPAGLEKEFIFISKPLERVCVFSDRMTETLEALGFQASRISAEQPDYRALVLEKIQAVLAEETMLPCLIGEPTDRFATLGIPMIVDCSGLEETEEAREDWLVLYRLLLEVE